MFYLLLAVLLGTLCYLAWRGRPRRPKTRVIGPDDDPEFLWRLGHGGHGGGSPEG